jgi:YfiH family protein
LKKFRLVFLRQVHSSDIHVVSRIPKKKKAGDAIMTGRQGLMLVIKTADCLPVLMADEDGRAVAAVHCGWRGTGRRLVQKVVDGMVKNFGCDPSSLLVAFGPAIGASCYEVGEDVQKEFEKAGLEGSAFHPHPRRKDKLLLDLRHSNKIQLLEKGVRDSNLFEVDLCSHCRKEFFSYRREGETKRRMLSFIGLVT